MLSDPYLEMTSEANRKYMYGPGTWVFNCWCTPPAFSKSELPVGEKEEFQRWGSYGWVTPHEVWLWWSGTYAKMNIRTPIFPLLAALGGWNGVLCCGWVVGDRDSHAHYCPQGPGSVHSGPSTSFISTLQRKEQVYHFHLNVNSKKQIARGSFRCWVPV